MKNLIKKYQHHNRVKGKTDLFQLKRFLYSLPPAEQMGII